MGHWLCPDIPSWRLPWPPTSRCERPGVAARHLPDGPEQVGRALAVLGRRRLDHRTLVSWYDTVAAHDPLPTTASIAPSVLQARPIPLMPTLFRHSTTLQTMSRPAWTSWSDAAPCRPPGFLGDSPGAADHGTEARRPGHHTVGVAPPSKPGLNMNHHDDCATYEPPVCLPLHHRPMEGADDQTWIRACRLCRQHVCICMNVTRILF